MAATGFTPISLYYTTTAAAVPVNTNLVNGELAINITDGKLYYKDNAGVVKLLASNATVAPVTTFSAGTTGFTPSTATSGAVTLAGTLNVANGGTGLTTLTAGYIPFGAGTSAFGSSSNLFWDNSNVRLGIGTASPGQPLTVSSNSTGSTLVNIINTSVGGYSWNIGTVGSSAGLGAVGSLIVRDSTVGVNRLIIDTSGNVGIGTDSPSYKLDVNASTIRIGSSASDGVITLGTSDVARTGLTSSTEYRVGWGRNTSVNLTFLTNDTERMRISSAGLVGVGTASATAMLQTAGSSSVAAFKTPNIVEVATVSATAATGTINFDITTQSVVYYTSNASANWTVNFRGSSGTSLNTIMAIGESMSATFLVTQGSTAYYNSAVQVDGSSVTPKWQGGTAPTSGNASSIDSYTYVLIKTANATFTVLATQTKFA